MLGVLQRAGVQRRLLGRLERALLDPDRLELPDQRGERRAQVVRDAGDHLAAVRVGRLHPLHLELQALEGLAEGAAELSDLVVAVSARKEARAGLVAEARFANALGGPRERDQRAGEHRDHRQRQQHADREREQPDLRGGADRVAAQQLGHLAGEVRRAGDHVEPAADLPTADHRTGRDQAGRAPLVGVVGEHRRRRAAAKRLAHRIEVHAVVAPEGARLARGGEHAALVVQEVQARVRGVEDVLAQPLAEGVGVGRVLGPEPGVHLQHALGEASGLRVEPVGVVAAHRRAHDQREQQRGDQAGPRHQQQHARAQRAHRCAPALTARPRSGSRRRAR